MTFSHYIGVFVLVFPLSFYYPTNGRQGTLQWGEKRKSVPVPAPLQHFPSYLFTENVLRKTHKMAFPRPQSSMPPASGPAYTFQISRYAPGLSWLVLL